MPSILHPRRATGARRRTATLSLAAALGLMSTFASLPADAAAPMARAQAPGYYRLALGSFEVTALNDGSFDLPVDKLLKQPADRTAAELATYFQKPPVETSVNAFLVNTGSKLVLIDTGTGGLSGPTAGTLVANLIASGYRPEQVDDIFITHMHGDHVGGLAKDGVAVFANAVVHAGKADADYWLVPANLEKAPDAAKGGFRTAMASLAPYIAAKRFEPVTGDMELVPGIRSWGTPGHTPGHTSYLVESQGQSLLVIGDLIHVAAVQFDDPSVTIAFDSDGEAARMARDKAFTRAAKEGLPIAAAHLQFPGIGRLKASGQGWQFVPANYQRMR